MEKELLIETVKKIDPTISVREKTDRPCVVIPLDVFHKVMEILKNQSDLKFDFLMSHYGIDWIEQKKFELIYLLFSCEHTHQLMVSVSIDRDNPVIPTVRDLWAIAEWQEREAYDLMGILYDNHPDLRRVFLEDDWVGFPLRKDYKDDFMLEMPE